MSLRPIIQSCAEQLAVARRCFVTAPFYRRRSARDQLLVELAYGVQNCLRSLSMQFPASVDTHPKDGNPTEIEVPLVSGAVPSEASADAPPSAPSLQTPQGGDS